MAIPSEYKVSPYPKFINGRKVYTTDQEQVILDEMAERGKLPSQQDLDKVVEEEIAKEQTAGNSFATDKVNE